MTDTGLPSNRNNSSKNDNDNGSNSSGYSSIFINTQLSSSDVSDESGNSNASYESIKSKNEEVYDNPVFVDPTEVSSIGSGNTVNTSIKKEHAIYCKQKRSLKTWMTLGIIGLCIIGVAIWIFYNKYYLGLYNANDPASAIKSTPIPGQCENKMSTAKIGEQICISYTSIQRATSSPSSIQVQHMTSQYFNALEMFEVNVSSNIFLQQNGDWKVYYNSSDQQFILFKEKATCDNMGNYTITIKYDDGNTTSHEFEINLKDPKLQQSVTRINDSIYVHCEMTNSCKARYLDLIVNSGGSSRLIPAKNECSNNDKKNSSTITADAIIPVSWFTGNQTISCVPLMTEYKLAASLTSTINIPVCEGDDCLPNCKDVPQGAGYFQDKHICNIFYQCSNGDIILQNCSNETSWSHSECTCVHFNDEICDKKTFRFFQPAMSFAKCTKMT